MALSFPVRRPHGAPALLALACVLSACGESALLRVDSGYGADPALPPPVKTVLPTVKVATAQPWPPGEAPTAAAGTTVQLFANQLDHPRWVYVLPNGDVLVAETNAPERPLRQELLGIRGWVMGLVMKRAGAATPSADRITLLRDADGDGSAEVRSVFLDNLHSPFGMALVGGELFIANTDALVKVPYQAGDTRASGPVTRVADLPGGPLNHHWTKGLVASADGSRLYVSVGSNSNVAEHGMGHEEGRAAIWEFDRASGQGRVLASGLRNPVGMAWQGGPFADSGMFVGQHGSWNRKPPSGYKVIYVPFAGAQPSGPPVDVLTGFLSAEGQARGRPVGVAVDRAGDLLVADDVGNVIWRVTGQAKTAPDPGS
jgi:glucose/arabinose dehydrogenase